VGCLPFGNVPRDLRKTNEFTTFIADSVNDNEGPKLAPILAHAPALGGEAPRFSGGLESLLRKTVGSVFRRIENGERFSNDLFGDVASAVRPRNSRS
jgi:hypothetical protein